MQTYGGCEWKLNENKETNGKGDLCSNGWLHYYKTPGTLISFAKKALQYA